MKFSKKVACGQFVKRQTKDSGYSHFDGSWEELEQLVESELLKNNRVAPGYRDGVLLVGLPNQNFYSAVVSIDTKTKLQVSYAPRREKEAPFIRVCAKAKKQPAFFVSVVLYRHDVLAENNERETDAEWEIVAIKARVDSEEEPMDPYTMARNFLHLEGGTKGDFTAEQFAKSIVYWNNHCMTTGKPKWYRFLSRIFCFIRKECQDAGLRIFNNLEDGKY